MTCLHLTLPGKLRASAAATAMAMALLGASAASAQGAGQPAGGDTPTDAFADTDIIVTANRREESVNKVPISITAIGEETLRSSRVQSGEDLQYLAPNLTIANYFGMGRPDISLRGLTVVDGIEASDSQPVGVYFDDVFLGARESQLFQIYDLSRVEVVRGPQGTLFGRNTSAGAISYYSQRPSWDEGTSYVKGTLGNYAYKAVEGGINLPVSDSFALRASGVLRDRNGYGYNDINNERIFDQNVKAGRLQARFRQGDFDATLAGNYGKSRTDGLYYYDRDYTGGFYHLRSALTDAPERIETYGASLRMSYAFTGFDLVSVSGYQRTQAYTLENFTKGTRPPSNVFDLWAVLYTSTQRQFSQELRLVSNGDGPLSWVVGGFGYWDHLDGVHDSGAGITIFRGTTPWGGARIYRQETQSYAVFGQATYALNDQLNLTGGLRYTHDHKDLLWRYDSLASTDVAPLTRSKGWGALSGKASIDYTVAPGTMIYASYSRGFKSGGFNTGGTTATQVTTVDPETVNAYEIGIKAQLAPWARTNISVFRNDVSDFQASRQINTPLGLQFVLDNAASVRSQGAEFELNLRPTPALRANFTLAYVDSKFLEFVVTAAEDYSGNSLPHAPKWSASADLGYTAELSGGATLTPSVFVSYKSRQQSRQKDDPLEWTDSRTLVDAQLDFKPAGDRFGISLFVKNLFDERYITKSINEASFLGGVVQKRGTPRMFGASATVSW